MMLLNVIDIFAYFEALRRKRVNCNRRWQKWKLPWQVCGPRRWIGSVARAKLRSKGGSDGRRRLYEVVQVRHWAMVRRLF